VAQNLVVDATLCIDLFRQPDESLLVPGGDAVPCSGDAGGDAVPCSGDDADDTPARAVEGVQQIETARHAVDHGVEPGMAADDHLESLPQGMQGEQQLGVQFTGRGLDRKIEDLVGSLEHVYPDG